MTVLFVLLGAFSAAFVYLVGRHYWSAWTDDLFDRVDDWLYRTFG